MQEVGHARSAGFHEFFESGAGDDRARLVIELPDLIVENAETTGTGRGTGIFLSGTDLLLQRSIWWQGAALLYNYPRKFLLLSFPRALARIRGWILTRRSIQIPAESCWRRGQK